MGGWKPRDGDEYPTLGWQVIDWITEYLGRPDIADYEPLVPTAEQEDFILRFYEIDPKTGRRVIQRGVISRPRGWGKSPFAGMIAAAEALGPVKFDGWDADGQPVGAPWEYYRTPIVNIAAVSEQQTLNTFDAVKDMLSTDQLHDDYPGLEILGGFVNLPRGKITPISASASSIKGARAVFSVLDQALALDTPIPTPSGWATMGALEAGDVIYGTSGPVTVTEAKPVMYDHDCYRVTLADGSSVVASEGHLWLSRRASWPAKYEQVRATKDMLDGYTYRIPVAKPQERPEIDLPVDPYLLGLWLGDGTRGKCEIAVGENDVESTVEILEGRGIETNVRRYTADAACNVSFSKRDGYQGSTRPEVAKRLASLSCYREKHVPDVYLSGSIEQRTELLRGLMDADGSVTKKGVCLFRNTNLGIVDAAVKLARSLGQVTTGIKTVKSDRYANGAIYHMTFTPRHGINPFKLPRKRERVHNCDDSWITIRSIEKVDRVPVRCIAVDSDDHLFAYGESAHFTHNTEVWTKSNGGVNLATVMRSNAGKVGGATLETPNAFIPGMGSVAEMSAAFWHKIESGEAREPSLLYDHREAPASTDMSDRESLIAGLRVAYGDSAKHPDGCVIHKPACPSGWVDLDSLVSVVWDPATDPQVSRSDFLNQVTHASDSYLSQVDIRAVMDKQKRLEEGDTIVMGFDGSRGRSRGTPDATALIAARIDDRFITEVKIWEKGPNDDQDWQPPLLDVQNTIDWCFEHYNVVGFYADPSGWQSQVAEWEAKYGRKLKVRPSRNSPVAAWPRSKTSAVSEWVENLRQAIWMHEVTIGSSHRMVRHLLNARMRSTRTGYLLYKAYPDSPDKIDGAYAAMLAFRAMMEAVSLGVGPRKNDGKKRKIGVL